jgi:cell division transport system permease protein
VQSVEDQVSIAIFIHDDAPQGDIDSLTRFIEGLPEVTDGGVYFVTKEEALERFKEQSYTAGIAEEMGGNPLPASIEVDLDDPEEVQSVVDQIRARPEFLRVIDMPEDPDKSIRYGAGTVEMLFSLARIIRYVCLALVVLLIFVALIFINNTIRLSILARRKEIAIMRLVGASNGFIRGPFLTEGTLQALIGAGLAILTIKLITDNLFPTITNAISWLPLNLAAVELNGIYLLLLGVGLVIGLFGSAVAMRRYLKV